MSLTAGDSLVFREEAGDSSKKRDVPSVDEPFPHVCVHACSFDPSYGGLDRFRLKLFKVTEKRVSRVEYDCLRLLDRVVCHIKLNLLSSRHARGG